MNDLIMEAENICSRAKAAARQIATAHCEQKNKALHNMAEILDLEKGLITSENAKDLIKGKEMGLSEAMLDRLTLDKKRIASMIKGCKEIAVLEDPVGRLYDERVRPNGLSIKKMKVPIGVILMIYESRPNVTVDSAALCMKSGNCVILRGGKEAAHSNKVLAHLFQRALGASGISEDAIQLVETPDRAFLDQLLKMNTYIDLVMPRGGEGLIRAVAEKSSIPTIKHYKGVCHVYVDDEADLNMAKGIVLNAKTQRPGVCNAMESLLLNKKLPEKFLIDLFGKLHGEGVEVRGCKQTCALDKMAVPAKETDWSEEYLGLVLSTKIVGNMDEAIAHISTYSSLHTDAIITENTDRAREFVQRVDSSSVMVNASTRFSDGGEYGLGAEIGISTDKLHARGPMGLGELTTYKWVVEGKGQIRI